MNRSSSEWRTLRRTAHLDAETYRRWAGEADAQGNPDRAANWRGYAAQRDGDALHYEHEHHVAAEREAQSAAETARLLEAA